MTNLCPCGSTLAYLSCCSPLHLGEHFAHDAEALMRSRYAAYVLEKIDYIIETTIPSQQVQLDRHALETWSRETDWIKLEVIQHLPRVDKIHAQVEFKAYFQEEEKIAHHHELSTFVKIDQKWYFLDPTVENYLTMKQPCLCGSGKKYKLCCASYL